VFSVAVYTLGCKLNQVESEAVADAFRREGFSLLPWDETAAVPPDILIINTCTVTSKADQKARRLIRKALRDHPRSLVIVAGCYAQLESEALEKLEAECAPVPRDAPSRPTDRRLFVLKGGGKSAAAKGVLLDMPRFIREAFSREGRTGEDAGGPATAGDLRALVASWAEGLQAPYAAEGRAGECPPESAFRFTPEVFSCHTRGFLKIQDGCDNHCTYCRIRLARGPGVSLGAEQALAELRELEAKGYAEVVLTGVNITQYRDCGTAAACGGKSGGDQKACGLGELLAYLLEGTQRIALRLSSLDPEAVTGPFAGALAHRRIRPHFHLSVQSGSAVILKKMGRNYGPETVERAAALLRSVKDNPFLACDIITGFPGETGVEFEKTLALCRNTGFAWIHAFPYSKRPGTPAFSFRETVNGRDASRRMETLLELARRGRQGYVRQWQGRETEVLIEEGGAEKPGYCRGTSENYLKLLVKHTGTHTPPPGTVLRCKITSPSSRENTPNSDLEYDSEAVEIKMNCTNRPKGPEFPLPPVCMVSG
jgi:threonylcarbamoyladenosine tRNA methylthiotransferase MtaB